MVPVPSSVVDGDSLDEPMRLTADDPLSGLANWLAEGRVDAAASERARQRWLERQAAEGASLAGVLLDLAEQSRRVAVRTAGGTTVTGRIAGLAADFVAIRDHRRGDALIPFRSVATVRGAPGEPAPTGDRSGMLALVLGEALLELAADRPTVMVSAGDADLRGELISAGLDVVAIALSPSRRDVVHVALEAIDHLTVLNG